MQEILHVACKRTQIIIKSLTRLESMHAVVVHPPKIMTIKHSWEGSNRGQLTYEALRVIVNVFR